MVVHDEHGHEFDVGVLTEKIASNGVVIAILQKRVDDLESAKKWDKISTFGATFGAAALLVTLGGMALAPAQTSIADLKEQIRIISRDSFTREAFLTDRGLLGVRFERDEQQIKILDEQKLDRREHIDFKDATLRSDALQTKTIDDKFAVYGTYAQSRIDALIERVNSMDLQFMKRPEIETQLRGLDTRLEALAVRLTNNEKIFTDFLNAQAAAAASLAAPQATKK